jgi:hypothetical protein
MREAPAGARGRGLAALRHRAFGIVVTLRQMDPARATKSPAAREKDCSRDRQAAQPALNNWGARRAICTKFLGRPRLSSQFSTPLCV